jgi:hypothetical protein
VTTYNISETAKKNLIIFLDELNELLRNHNLNIQFMDGALFSKTSGYIGQLEDNRDQVVISDGLDDSFSSSKIIPKD